MQLLSGTCGWWLPHWTALVFSISPPLVTQIARLLLFPTHNGATKLHTSPLGCQSGIGMPGPPSQLRLRALLNCRPLLLCGQKPRFHSPGHLDWNLGLPLAGRPVLRPHPEPLIPSLQDGLQPRESGRASGVTQRPWDSCLSDQPSNRPALSGIRSSWGNWFCPTKQGPLPGFLIWSLLSFLAPRPPRHLAEGP